MDQGSVNAMGIKGKSCPMCGTVHTTSYINRRIEKYNNALTETIAEKDAEIERLRGALKDVKHNVLIRITSWDVGHKKILDIVDEALEVSHD